MMMATLGLDNIAVAFALGPLQLGRRRTALLAVSFGLTDAGMTLLGLALGPAWLPTPAMAEVTRAGALVTLAMAGLGLGWIRCRPAAFVGNPWMLAGLALLLGIDNLIAGSAADAAAVSLASIVAMGALTGGLAAAACAAGAALFRPVPRWSTAASAVMLAGLAVAGIAS
jgi:putative Mn2+ efflux pump MntP